MDFVAEISAAAPAAAAPARAGEVVPVAGGAPALLSRARYAGVLAPRRAGDPLGLGYQPGERPPPPPDADLYDRAAEDRGYCRSLLAAEDRKALDAELAREGFLTLPQVRALIAENTVKGALEEGGLDPELLILLDARTDRKLFIAGDNVYSREELYEHFPFQELGTAPEVVFAQQEVGVFYPAGWPAAGAEPAAKELEYVVRDAGDESVDFTLVADLVRAERPGAPAPRRPRRIVKSKVYVGREAWTDFVALQAVCRGAVRATAARLASGAAPVPLLAGLLGGLATPRLLLGGGGDESKAQARAVESLAAREAALAQRAEEVREEAARVAAALERVESLLLAAPR